MVIIEEISFFRGYAPFNKNFFRQTMIHSFLKLQEKLNVKVLRKLKYES
jgi:hypothetical protein